MTIFHSNFHFLFISYLHDENACAKCLNSWWTQCSTDFLYAVLFALAQDANSFITSYLQSETSEIRWRIWICRICRYYKFLPILDIHRNLKLKALHVILESFWKKNLWKLEFKEYEPFWALQGLSLYLESRIRIRIKVMRILNTAIFQTMFKDLKDRNLNKKIQIEFYGAIEIYEQFLIWQVLCRCCRN
jgi:hypothetical protein